MSEEWCAQLIKEYGEEAVKRNPLPEWFDRNRVDNHPQVSAMLDGKTVQVDKALKGLLERINAKYIHTLESCQYNVWGWAVLVFDYVSYHFFLNKIRRKHHEKYDNKPSNASHSLWTYIRRQPQHCVQLKVEEFKEDPDKFLRITWKIPPQDIKNLVGLWDDLFEQ